MESVGSISWSRQMFIDLVSPYTAPTRLIGTDHTTGINFPCYAFENQAETEGFAKMAKRAGYRVIGLPNYVVWHIDTEEKIGNLGYVHLMLKFAGSTIVRGASCCSIEAETVLHSFLKMKLTSHITALRETGRKSRIDLVTLKTWFLNLVRG